MLQAPKEAFSVHTPDDSWGMDDPPTLAFLLSSPWESAEKPSLLRCLPKPEAPWHFPTVRFTFFGERARTVISNLSSVCCRSSASWCRCHKNRSLTSMFLSLFPLHQGRSWPTTLKDYFFFFWNE